MGNGTTSIYTDDRTCIVLGPRQCTPCRICRIYTFLTKAVVLVVSAKKTSQMVDAEGFVAEVARYKKILFAFIALGHWKSPIMALGGAFPVLAM